MEEKKKIDVYVCDTTGSRVRAVEEDSTPRA